MLHCNNEMKVKDRRRDRIWESMGLTVLRFSDREVFKDIGAVVEKIWKYL